MALVSGRFKLDPRAPEPARPATPPLAPPRGSAPSSTRAPPSPSPSTPPPPSSRLPPPSAKPTRTNRKMLVIAAAVVALLLVGGAIAVFVATVLGYPDKYVLERDEMPSGMSNARLTSTELRDAGMSGNPGEIDWQDSEFADAFSQAGLDDPERAHGQVLAAGASKIVVLALKYPDADAAQSAAQSMRQICSFGSVGGLQAMVMRDDDVLVIVISEDGASRAQVQAVGSALREKASGLERSCST